MEAKSHQIMHNSAMTRICLITPPSPFLDQRVFPALGILKVAAVLEQAGYTVDHLDLTGVSNYEEAAKDYQIEAVFAITATTPQIPGGNPNRPATPWQNNTGRPHAKVVNAGCKEGKRTSAKGPS